MSQLNTSVKPQPPIVAWQLPDAIPEVEVGTEEKYWIAVRRLDRDREIKDYVFLAYYMNRPVPSNEPEDDYAPDWVFHDSNGDAIDAIGWHSELSHPEFSEYYEPITFDDSYQLLGWAEYQPPVWGG